MDYLMELCEVCNQPIGYKVFMTDGNGEHLIHAECLNKADLKDRGFVPVTISRTEVGRC